MEDKTTILIVDDEPGGRETLTGALILQGYKLLLAENGPQALEIAAEKLPDLVLLDSTLPQMDGFEVCRRMRSDPMLAEIPILLITSADDRAARLKGLEVGADDFVSRPFDRMELRARVKTVTRLNRYRRLMLERARFVWVVDNAADGYLSIDADGSIHYANAAARGYLSLPGDENTPIQGAFLDWVRKQFECVPAEAWVTWPQVEMEDRPLYLVRPQDMQNRVMWLQVNVLDLPWGAEEKLLVRIREVSKTVTMAEEMWSFQSAVRHKFFTPLSNILLATGFVDSLPKGQVPIEVLDAIKTIEAAAQRLDGEVKDVVQYIHVTSVAQTGGAFFLKNLQALVNQIVSSQPVHSAKVKIRDQSLLSHSLCLSNYAMQIVLWEIVENAYKFHPSMDPNIEFELFSSAPDRVTLLVRDDGVRLAPDQLFKVWVPYYQVEKGFSGEISGMGLGLPTVATLVWGSGGNIRLYNREDRPGLVVELSLPIQ